MASIPQISATELADRLQAEDRPVLLDVREPEEVEICNLPDHVHIPMAQVPQGLDRLPRDRPVVVYCHSGMRSAQVTAFLRQHGLDAVNLAGGIDAWSRTVDPDVPRY